MPAAVLIRRTAAAILGLLALGAVGLLPWWQQWVDVGGSTDVTRWNVWQASDLASSALILAGLALVFGTRRSPGASAAAWYAPAGVAWTSVLLLAVQVSRIGSGSASSGQVGATLTDLQGDSGVQPFRDAQAAGRPDLHVIGEGAVRADLGVGAFLGALVVVAVAVLLTAQAVRRPDPAAAAAAPVTRVDVAPVIGLVLLGVVSLFPWWRQPSGVWNVWQVSRAAAVAVALSMLALLLTGRIRAGSPRAFRLLPAVASWGAVLLLAVRWYLLERPSAAGGSQGIQYVRAVTPEYLKLVEDDRPVLAPGIGGLGYGAYLGGVLVLAVAVILTARARKPDTEPGRPVAESGGPAAG